MKMNATVSVLIPVHNEELYLRQCLESLKNQTVKPHQIVCVLNNCTDNSEKICEEFDFDNLMIIKTAQKGVGNARAFGWNFCTGDFVAIMDADDICYSDRLQVQLETMNKYSKANLCIANADLIDGDSNRIGGYTVKSVSDLNRLDWECAIVNPSCLLRKEYFDNNNILWDTTLEYGEDLDMWLQFRKSPNPNVVHIDKSLIQYRCQSNKEQLSSKSITKQYSDNIRKIYRKHNIDPVVSVISDSKNALYNQSLYNIEVVSNIEKANGKYIAFWSDNFKNNRDRLLKSVRFLESAKNTYSAVGTYIGQSNNKTFYYTQDPDIIESQLSRAKLAFEPASLLFVNNPVTASIVKSNDYYYEVACSLLQFGKITNIDYCGLSTESYTQIDVIEDYTRRYDIWEKYYSKNVINVVQLNITGDGNFSGVDRYLLTLEKYLPNNIRMTTITFVLSDKTFIDKANNKFYYNRETALESLYPLFWDNFNKHFVDKQNLIVQSNCLNLYTLQTFIRQKVYCKLVCAVHCVPYREVIRSNREEYSRLENVFNDVSQEFIDKPSHSEPLKIVDRVLLNTDDSEEWYLRCGYDKNKYSKVYNGIQEFETKSIVKKEYADKEFRFLFVGHGSQLKGMDQIIQIVQKLVTVPNIPKFIVLWAGTATKDLLNIIEQNKLPIKSLGVQSPQDIELLYSLVDCTIIASACETCSYAAIESMSARLPIIATRVHGVEEIVEDCGVLIDTDNNGIIDQTAYMNAMISVMTDYDLRTKLSNNTIEAFKKYDVTNMIHNIKEVYYKLCNS
jgi:glycosyltransferase involved in cell wall biosynthesis